MPAKKTTETAASEAAEKKTVKKTAAAKTAAEDKTEKKPAAKKAAAKKTAAKKTTAKKTAVKEEVKAEPAKEAEQPKNEVAVKPKAEVAVVEAAPAKEEPKAEAPVKEEAPKEEAKAEAKEEAAPAEEAKPVKKTAAKKTTAKKAAAKKAEEPAAEEAKAEVKEEAAPAEEAKPAKKTAAKKTTAKKAAAKTEEAKPAKKTAVKKTAAKKEAEKAEEPAAPAYMNLTDEKMKAYDAFPVETLLEMANALGMAKSMDALKDELAVALDVPAYTEKVLLANVKPDHGYVFEDDGFDETVIPVLVEKVLAVIPVKSSDYMRLAEEIEANKDFKLTGNPIADADEYHILFDLVKQILMIGQKNHIHSLEEIKTVVPADARKLIETFMDVAYDLLPTWQYNDVEYYKEFLYAVLTQFNELYDLHNRAMMDVADLFIKHGDYGQGDADYNYVIRENDIKDYIFFRFANVYRPIDLQKAKSIAGSALRYVDGRYDFYPMIMEIINC